jgi:two-component system OmpR family sensor kinase
MRVGLCGASRWDLAALASDAGLDASATHLSRSVEVEAPVSVVVEGDEARLRQVVANLVSNALVHTDATTTVRVRAERRGEVALLGVTDDGPGMDDEAATRAFDRFWRADPSRPRGGGGLGLAIVRSIVTAHAGEVRLETAPGVGTTVRVVLAVTRQAAETAETDAHVTGLHVDGGSLGSP